MELPTAFDGVTAETLVPSEIPTPLKLLRQADCYQQIGVKYPLRGTYHSYAELLHGALCEGDATVTAFIPQPFRLQLHGRVYIPDAYVVRAGERIVAELKPRGEFDESRLCALTTFFRFHQMTFVVISNESVLERETEALNWLHVIRTLCTATAVITEQEERLLWERFYAEPQWMLGDVLDSGDRQAGLLCELALYRLLHRGQLHAHWQRERLHPQTVFERCA